MRLFRGLAPLSLHTGHLSVPNGQHTGESARQWDADAAEGHAITRIGDVVPAFHGCPIRVGRRDPLLPRSLILEHSGLAGLRLAFGIASCRHCPDN
jgi:hypothetical protein